MEIKTPAVRASATTAAVAFLAIFVISMAVTPLAIAASAGSEYAIEVIRAHTAYKVVDPPIPVQIGLGVHGNR